MKRMTLMLLLLSNLVCAEGVQSLDKVVALVNDDVITETELDSQVALLKKQIIAKNTPMPEEKLLRKQVLQHLIDLDLQLQLAKNNGVNVDSIELNDALNTIAKNNNMTLSQMREEIERQGMSWKDYRQNIRKEIIISQLQQRAVNKEIVITNDQVEDYLKTAQQGQKEQQVFRLQNILIPLPEEPTSAQLQKAKIKAADLLIKIKKGEDFYHLAAAESSGEYNLQSGDLGERHLAELPEIFGKEVLKMKAGEVAGPLRTGNGLQFIKLISISGDKEKQSHIVTQTHVRHILLKPGPSATPIEAKKQADNLYQQLKSGKNFALLAKQYSHDVSNAAKGGDLGWINPGELVPEFEKTMDSLPINKISHPVKTQYGWHLIEVLERKKVDNTAAFEKQQVRQSLQQRKFMEAVQNWQQHLRTEAYVNILDKDLA